jgi:hypothetical protein
MAGEAFFRSFLSMAAALMAKIDSAKRHVEVFNMAAA